jgi:hypothetical protein
MVYGKGKKCYWNAFSKCFVHIASYCWRRLRKNQCYDIDICDINVGRKQNLILTMEKLQLRGQNLAEFFTLEAAGYVFLWSKTAKLKNELI